MSSYTKQLGDAVVTAINAATLSFTPNAEFTWRPDAKLAGGLDGLSVLVTPDGVEFERARRSGTQTHEASYTVAVTVAEKVDAIDAAATDAIAERAEEITRALRNAALQTPGTVYHQTEYTIDPVADTEQLAEMGVAVARITCTYLARV